MKNRKSMPILLILLLSPFLPLITLPSVQAATDANSSPVSQSNGVPLQPGSVSYTNSYNQTQTLVCPPSISTSQPLSPILNNVTIMSEIPAFLLMNDPVGPPTEMSYTIFANGTLSVSDNKGNSFSISSIQGL